LDRVESLFFPPTRLAFGSLTCGLHCYLEAAALGVVQSGVLGPRSRESLLESFEIRRILPLLGLALGEFFDLEKLTERCYATNRWEFFFVANPLKLPGGIGSPGNAMAIL
jgi:hypothetical protein